MVTLSRFSDKKRTKFSNFFVVRIDYQSGHNVGYQEKLVRIDYQSGYNVGYQEKFVNW